MGNIRNFLISSHIDHGKSTLADRFLEITKTIELKKMKPQFLDRMDLEREKGITIKLKPVRMNYGDFILNLIDTPGHVDFSYEVSRALAAVEGAILLVDATQGIQAQTLANLDLAKKQNLVIIPAVNKIDAADARIEQSQQEIANLLNIDPKEVLKISGKTGANVEELLKKVIEVVPAPEIDIQKPFRALIFDSNYDSFKGVIAFVRVIDGEISSGEKIRLMATKTEAEVKEIGFFNPGLSPQKKLSAGEIGYIATGIKEPGKVRVGDTIVISSQFKINNSIEPLHGYQEPSPMVFASFYPQDANDFDLLKDALAKLKLSDPAFIYEPETKEALGRGYRCGFLGTLHVEIISERLRREFGLELVISTPSVVYKIIDQKGKEDFIYSASDWPQVSQIKSSEEPWVSLELITPSIYLSKLMEVLKSLGGKYIDTQYLSFDRAIIIYEIPLRGIITNLYDKIKSVSQGYASMSYKVLGFRPGNLVKMEIWIAGTPEEAFSKIVAESEAYREGKFLVEKLKEVLPAEQFSVALQAVVQSKVIARETIRARRKDVTGYLYGGDVTRKRKLLEKQKKGKKLLKQRGKVEVSHQAFLEIFKSRQ
ncbi:translation elongation factor 4 [Patescibacteria group bacterium]|nr:translation elongation factor 4 [Patescibacteria group bacterium]MBU4367673.1 translation elongation factor 4 [Patescibacteria group bacterium]MBU4461877.1 translation elongation factor 4 [Patescibacteria group bacterium]MCG2699992.1 translation elongation factor 4 [Candidatus Parcubacteria bacterium]